MRKDIEWLVQMIDSERESLRKRFESGKGTHNETTFNEGMDWALSKVLKMICQLDNLEVLSKELPVIPKHVADWITKHREKFDLYPALKELEESVWGWERTYKWYRMNTHKFVNAYLTGEYEVEEEQKYYVDLDSSAYVAKWKEDGQVNIYTDAIFGSDEFEFHLTEQEIKNFDERFWAFAEPEEQWE